MTSPTPNRRRVILLVAAACLVILGVQGWAALQAYRTAARAEETEVLGVARSTSAALQQFLSVARRSTGSLADKQGMKLLTPEGCSQTIGALGDAFPFFANLLVVNADGSLVCSARGIPDQPVSAAERFWFTNLEKRRAFSVGHPVMGPVTDTWVVAMGSPIMTRDGEILGAVAGTVALLRLEEILLDPSREDGELVTITTDDGVVVARSVDAESWVGRALPSGTVEVERRGNHMFITRAEDASGLARVWGRVDLPDIGWRVYTGVPAARIHGPSFADVRGYAWTALVGMALVSVLAAFLFMGRDLPTATAHTSSPSRDPDT
jgi:hypothetical protein